MRISLVTDVKQNLIIWGLKDVVESDSELDDTQR